MKQHFRLDTHPIADPANVVRGDRYRVAARSSNTPESTSGNTGFRCAGDA